MKQKHVIRKIKNGLFTGGLLMTLGLTSCYPGNQVSVAYAQDLEKPTLIAAISDGMLSIQANGPDYEIQKIFVNGYEFDGIEEGKLDIQLQQFDAGYQEFTVQAMDQAGVMSEVYTVPNPYYTSVEDQKSGDQVPAMELPVSAVATEPEEAVATVTEHVRTNKKMADSGTESEIEAPKENLSEGQNEWEKEFYTIQTASEKTFYLIIDRSGETETVHFLTDVSENDLLNTVANTSQTMPKNSAVAENRRSVTENALPRDEKEETQEKNTDETDSNVPEEEKGPENSSVTGTYLFLGGIGAAVIGVWYYLKRMRKKNEDFLDEDDDDDDEEAEEEAYEPEIADTKEENFLDEDDAEEGELP